jgi:L-ascorbate metabolism protein UlaG (beta-lactamase superfamily)
MAGNIRLTKFAHSCVLVEYDSKAVLFDPGNYGWETCQTVIDKIDHIDIIAITHEHADHFYLPFVEAVMGKFPAVKILSSQQVLSKLGGLPATAIGSEPDQDFQFFTAPHEDLPFSQPGPENTGIHFADVFTHPGDSHSFNETRHILAMPMTAPWGSMVSALDKIVALKPRIVLPIHDWQWRPDALENFYIRFQEPLAAKGIQFLVPRDGLGIELEL